MLIRPSSRFAILLLLLHMMAAILAYATDIPPGARLAILLLILLSAVYYLVRDILLLLPDSWREISLDQDRVEVISRDGTKLTGRLASETTVSPCFIVLRVRPEGRYLPLSRVIFPDTLSKGEFREFCVRLRFAC
jgi:hypothetical protein